MKRILFINMTIWLTVISLSLSYSQHSLMGMVVNLQQLPIEFVKVTFYQNDTMFVESAITDSTGFFSVSLQAGNYTIKFEKAGVEYWTTSVENYSGNVDLGTIALDETKILGEVQVMDEKPLWVRKPDRLIFNVENSIMAASGTLLDALRITPGVQVGTNNISIVGRSNVLILIEERNVHLTGESLMNYLSSISAESIQSIEVMTTPPAKYDAQGASGIINIRYKKGRKNAWKNSTTLQTNQSFYGYYSITDNFSYNKNRLSFDINIDGGIGYSYQLIDMGLYYPSQTWTDIGTTKVGRDNYSGRLNAAYQLSENSSLGMLVEHGQYVPPKNTSTANGEILENNIIKSRIYTLSEDLNREDWTSANLNYDLSFGEKGGNVTFNLDYFEINNKNNNFFNSSHTNANGTSILHIIGDNRSKLGITNYSGKVDVQHLGGLISYGAKTSSTETNSVVGFFDMTSKTPIEDTSRTNKFRYTENVQALYVNAMYGTNIIQFQLGMRYEYTHTKSHSQQKDSTNKRNYGNFFPTVFLMYPINRTDFININYSRRIGRPAFWEMDPFRMQLNPYSYIEGNPFLRPEYNNTFEITYGLKQKLYVQATIYNTSNGYAQLTRVDTTTKVQSLIRDNFYSTNQYSIALYYKFDLMNLIESQAVAQGHWGTSKLKNESYKDVFNLYDAKGGSFQIFNLIKNIDKKNMLNFEVGYTYNLPTKTLMFDIKETHSFDMGVRLYFMDRDLAFRAYIKDLFKTAIPYNESTSDGVRQSVTFYEQPPQHIVISARYQFGNKTIQTVDKEFGNEEELKRSKKN